MVANLKARRQTSAAKFVRPDEIVLSDGPMKAENWIEKRCVGRVVGYMAPY